MTILRIGSTEKYADNWNDAFGEAPAASKKNAKAAPAKKPAAKGKPSPKKSSKKSKK